MLNEIVRLFIAAVASLGGWAYLIVFLGPFLESSAFIGFFVPGETIMLLAGFLASRGDLNLRTCVWVSAIGAVAGDSVGYFIGKRVQEDYFETHERIFFVKREHIRKVEGYFLAHGGKTIFFARFVSFLRVLAPFVAGMSRMRYRQFFKYNAAGGVIWAIVYNLAGYFFGQNWPLLYKWLERAWIAFIAAVAVGTLIYLYARRRHEVFEWLMDRYDSMVSTHTAEMIRRRYFRLVATLEELLSPGTHFVLYLALGFGASIGFFWIWKVIFSGQPFIALDLWISGWIDRFRSPALGAALGVLARFAEVFAVVVGSMALVLFLLVRTRFIQLITFLAAIIGGEILNVILTLGLISRLSTYPSGDTLVVVVFYGFLNYLVFLDIAEWKFRLPVLIASLMLTLSAGYEQMYRHSATAGSVIAGYAEGFLWLAICIAALNTYGRRSRARRGPV